MGEAHIMTKDVVREFPSPTRQLETVGYEVHTTFDSGSPSRPVVEEANNVEGGCW